MPTANTENNPQLNHLRRNRLIAKFVRLSIPNGSKLPPGGILTRKPGLSEPGVRS